MEPNDNLTISPDTLEVKFIQKRRVRTRERNHEDSKRRNCLQDFGSPLNNKRACKENRMKNKSNFKEKVRKLGKGLRNTPKHIPHHLELLQLESAEEILKRILAIALNDEIPIEERKDFLKFIAERTISKRQTKMVYIPGMPRIQTLEDIEVASALVWEYFTSGQITPDEAESFFRSLENLNSILSSKQLKILRDHVNAMKHNITKTLTNSHLIEETLDRLNGLTNEEKLEKFKLWYKDILTLPNLLELLKSMVTTESEKLQLLKSIKNICQ